VASIYRTPWCSNAATTASTTRPRSLAVPLTDPAVTKTSLLALLLRKLRAKTAFDANRLYASELLAILIQADPANQRRLGAWEQERGTGTRLSETYGREIEVAANE